MEGKKREEAGLAGNTCRRSQGSIVLCACWWLPSCMSSAPALDPPSEWAQANAQISWIARAGHLKFCQLTLSRSIPFQYFPAFCEASVGHSFGGGRGNKNLSSLPQPSSSMMLLHTDPYAMNVVHTYCNHQILIQWCWEIAQITVAEQNKCLLLSGGWFSDCWSWLGSLMSLQVSWLTLDCWLI